MVDVWLKRAKVVHMTCEDLRRGFISVHTQHLLLLNLNNMVVLQIVCAQQDHNISLLEDGFVILCFTFCMSVFYISHKF